MQSDEAEGRQEAAWHRLKMRAGGDGGCCVTASLYQARNGVAGAAWLSLPLRHERLHLQSLDGTKMLGVGGEK